MSLRGNDDGIDYFMLKNNGETSDQREKSRGILSSAERDRPVYDFHAKCGAIFDVRKMLLDEAALCVGFLTLQVHRRI